MLNPPPRPQRVEVGQAVDALLDETAAALGGVASVGAELLRPHLHRYTLALLELLDVDSAGVTLRSDAGPPQVTRVRRPGHDEDV